MFLLCVACDDDPTFTFGVNGEERAPGGALACPFEGPDNGDGTRNLGWNISFVSDPNGTMFCYGAGHSGVLALNTNQLKPPNQLATLPIGDFAIAAWSEQNPFPVEPIILGYLSHDVGVVEIVGTGTVHEVSSSVRGSFTATGYDASGQPFATYVGDFAAY